MMDFRLIIREAKNSERRWIVARTGEELGSDACVVVWLDATLVGWSDDYGTFHLMPGVGDIAEAGEALLAAAMTFWERANR